jgi:site-specific DNA-cytosine methylase
MVTVGAFDGIGGLPHAVIKRALLRFPTLPAGFVHFGFEKSPHGAAIAKQFIERNGGTYIGFKDVAELSNPKVIKYILDVAGSNGVDYFGAGFPCQLISGANNSSRVYNPDDFPQWYRDLLDHMGKGVELLNPKNIIFENAGAIPPKVRTWLNKRLQGYMPDNRKLMSMIVHTGGFQPGQRSRTAWVNTDPHYEEDNPNTDPQFDLFKFKVNDYFRDIARFSADDIIDLEPENPNDYGSGYYNAESMRDSIERSQARLNMGMGSVGKAIAPTVTASLGARIHAPSYLRNPGLQHHGSGPNVFYKDDNGHIFIDERHKAWILDDNRKIIEPVKYNKSTYARLPSGNYNVRPMNLKETTLLQGYPADYMQLDKMPPAEELKS